MLNRIKALWELSSIYGLECYLDSDQKIAYFLIQVSKKGSKANIEFSQHFDNWEALVQTLDPSISVAIVFNGRGIITKSLAKVADDWTSIVQEAIPNANASDLVGQVYGEQNQLQLTLLRKSIAQYTISALTAEKMKVVGLFIGALNAAWVAPFLSGNPQKLPLRQQQLLIAVDKPAQILSEGKNERLHIGDQVIDSSFLLAFSAALKVLLGVPNASYNYDEINQNYKNALLVKRTNLGFISGGVLLLFLALINFMIFMYLRDAVANGGVQTYQYQQQLEQIQNLEQEIQRKQQLAGNNSVLAPSKVSFYADEIAWTLPSGIKLTTLNIFPKKADLKRQEENFQFEKGIILIEGQTRKSANLNLWIKQLESLDWITKVKVLPYKEDRTGLGTFELILQLNP